MKAKSLVGLVALALICAMASGFIRELWPASPKHFKDPLIRERITSLVANLSVDNHSKTAKEIRLIISVNRHNMSTYQSSLLSKAAEQLDLARDCFTVSLDTQNVPQLTADSERLFNESLRISRLASSNLTVAASSF